MKAGKTSCRGTGRGDYGVVTLQKGCGSFTERVHNIPMEQNLTKGVYFDHYSLGNDHTVKEEMVEGMVEV